MGLVFFNLRLQTGKHFLGSLDSTRVVCRVERVFHVTMGIPKYEKKYNLSLSLAISAELEAFYLWSSVYFYKKKHNPLHFLSLRFEERWCFFFFFFCRDSGASFH